MAHAKHESFRARRRFLLAASAAGAFFLLPGCGDDAPQKSAPPERDVPPVLHRGNLGTVIGPGRQLNTRTGEELYFVGIVDLDVETPQYRQIDDIHFFGHGVSPNPVKPKTAVIFEKHGKGCAEVDLRAGRTLRKIETVEGRQFYGHGAWTPDGRTLYATEAEVGDNSYHGVVAVRDGDTFELKGEFPSHGIAPHDCILVEEGRTLVITNGGGPIGNDHEPPCITYVDIKTRELKHRLTFPIKEINAGHIAITSRGELACVSAPRKGIDESSPGSISFYTPGGKLRTVTDHSIRRRMKSETLSVAIHEPGMVVGATNPDGHIVTFWDFKTGKLRHVIEDFHKPRGISMTLDERYFVLTYDVQTWIAVIDAETLKVVETFESQPSFIAGSHNITYDLPA